MWKSGVILRRSKSWGIQKTTGMLEGFLNFGIPHERKDGSFNFVQVTLPVNRMLRRILFVTPKIAKENPEGVIETYSRLYCNLVGILLDRKDLIKFKHGTFSEFTPLNSGIKLGNCLNEFEKIFGIKLSVAMIDSGPFDLSFPLQQEFLNRGIELFRHPANMLNGEFYYINPVGKCKEIEVKSGNESDVYNWYRDPLLRGEVVFHILAEFSPIITNKPKIFEQKVDTVPGKEEIKINEVLESVYGPLEEIPLDEVDENVNNFDNSDGQDDKNNFENEGRYYLTNLFYGETEDDEDEDEQEVEEENTDRFEEEYVIV